MGVRKVTRENGEIHVPGWLMGWVVSGSLTPLEFQIWALLAWASPRIVAVDFVTATLERGSAEVCQAMAKLVDRKMAQPEVGGGIGGWTVQPDSASYRKSFL